jgi:DNA mismatch repair protein MLH3
MPVRVKQRALAADHASEHDRLWEALKKDIAGLLLSRQPSVWLRIRDATGRTVLTFNTSTSIASAYVSASASVSSQSPQDAKPRSAHLLSTLQVLTQAKYIGIDDWASWVPASASTSAISIKGAISLEPAPAKHVQFLSLGIRPLSAASGHNELYDQINRLFASSTFGTLDENAHVNQHDALRRQSDGRFKNDGYTNRQLKARKGVDKYPMFHLRITLNGQRDPTLAQDRLVNDETNLQAVLDILGAMITQWLSVHHFRPTKSRKTVRPDTLSSTQTPVSPGRASTEPDSRKRKRQAMAPLHNLSEMPKRHAFAEWSRIKSGKSEFFTDARTQQRPRLESLSEFPTKSSRPSSQTQELVDFPGCHVDPVPRGAFDESGVGSNGDNKQSADAVGVDGTILWTDPATRKTHLLNSRTGCVMEHPLSRPHTDSNILKLATTQGATSQSFRIAQKPTTAEPVNTPWLDGIFKTWENPVFKQSEDRIQQSLLQQHEYGSQQHESGSSKLSKENLRAAEVVAQVDRKFILIKMQSPNDGLDSTVKSQTLVLIDQHAADERIQVESLLADLCAPLTLDHAYSGYQSQLGVSSRVGFISLDKPVQFTVPSQELAHFKTYAARFAAWGIMYDASIPRPENAGKSQCLISVTTLPPIISERCKSDPQLLISFLRAAIWRYTESPHHQVSSILDEGSTSWVRKLATCPPGLIDLVNSRACRSAIMFNDDLSLERCRELVQKLSSCVFPFMCAHGRPSMVPIGDLGSIGHATSGLGSESSEKSPESDFAQAWKNWKR